MAEVGGSQPLTQELFGWSVFVPDDLQQVEILFNSATTCMDACVLELW